MNDKMFNINRGNSGQSLIETIVAIFILTATLTASLGLALYAFSTADVSQQEIVASNLAREGVEVVRMMRDTNWLEGDAYGATDSTYALQACADIGNKLCFPRWLVGPSGAGFHHYDLSQTNNRVDFDPASNSWSIGNNPNYNLYLQATGVYNHTSNSTTPNFARRIIITYATGGGYTANNPDVTVQSVVGWRSRKCTWSGQDPTAAPASCKIIVEEHLTNWKDYK